MLLSSCKASLIDDRLYPYGNLFSSNRVLIDSRITSLPYASSIFQYNNNQEFVAILGKERNNFFYWYGPNDEMFITLNGKITRSKGLLYDFYLSSYSPINSESYSQSSFISFLDPSLGPLDINFIYETIELGEMKSLINQDLLNYRLIKESFNVPYLNWSGDNYYWLDINDNVIQSQQQVSPFSDQIIYRIIKKYSE